MRNLRAIHRMITVVVVLVTLYLGTSGTLIQLIDLRTLFEHAPATDANRQSMREGFNGTPNFQVITTPDYVASTLSRDANPSAMLRMVLQSVRSQVGALPLSYIEFRMVAGRPVGQIDAGGGSLLRFDAFSGAFVGKFPV